MDFLFWIIFLFALLFLIFIVMLMLVTCHFLSVVSSNDEVYGKMRKQRMLREELRQKKRELEAIMKKDGSRKQYGKNQDNQSDTVSYTTDAFGWVSKSHGNVPLKHHTVGQFWIYEMNFQSTFIVVELKVTAESSLFLGDLWFTSPQYEMS